MSEFNCPCPKLACENHGNCQACVAHHIDIGGVVTCMFPENKGDKSLKAFYEHLKEKFQD